MAEESLFPIRTNSYQLVVTKSLDSRHVQIIHSPDDSILVFSGADIWVECHRNDLFDSQHRIPIPESELSQ